ncbi:MAG: hypothetical protein IJ873_03790, partial [Lachnospiraceae bacterium]|nr:hypothetical protein [Lachnospiraceae bacterium]
MADIILLYEEKIEIRKELTDMLSDEYEIIETADYDDLIKKLTDPAKTPAVLLVSVTYPDAKGLTIIEKVVSTGLADVVPIVVMSERDNKI